MKELGKFNEEIIFTTRGDDGHDIHPSYVGILEVIYQTREGVFHQISVQTLRSRLKKTRRSRVFLNDFEVFGYLMKHTLECLIWLLK